MFPSYITEEAQAMINQYVKEDCVFTKAELLKEIKQITGLCYIELESELFEEKRTLKRIYSLNRLVPCLRKLVMNGIISVTIAYEIAVKDSATQYKYYESITRYLKEKKKTQGKLRTKFTCTDYQKVKENIYQI